MTEILNSPLILSIVFPALTAIGILPLLRWALSGAKSEIYASFSVALACLMAVVCAYGRPEFETMTAKDALFAFAVFMSVILLVVNLFVKFDWLKKAIVLPSLMVGIWILLSAPVEIAALMKLLLVILALAAGLGLIYGRVTWLLANRFEQHRVILTNIVVLVATMALAFAADAMREMYLAMALLSVCGAMLIWSIPQLKFTYQENSYVILSLLTVTNLLLLWSQNIVPFISVFFLILVFFASGVVDRALVNAHKWVKKAYIPIFIAFSALPAILSIVFFDILRNL